MVIENVIDRKLKNVEKKLLKGSLLKLQGVAQDTFSRYRPVVGLLRIIKKQSQTVNLYVDDNTRMSPGIHGRRSQGDLFLLMKYYYPDITFKEVRNLLFQLLNSEKISTDYCWNIRKRVFWPNQLVDAHIYSVDIVDEYNWMLEIV
jgi:hypothetical protein